MSQPDRQLLIRFEEAMQSIYEKARALDPPYTPAGFRGLLAERGGKGTADFLLASKTPSSGFTELYLRGKDNLRLSVEYLVLQEPWQALFTPPQLDVARRRLEAVECELPLNPYSVSVGEAVSLDPSGGKISPGRRRGAVFAKNHLNHLQAAAAIGQSDATQLVVFRSERSWAEASRLLVAQGSGAVPILFAVTDRGPMIHYRAILREVMLKPSRGDARAEDLLRLRAPSTAQEDVWSSPPLTLYAISGCYELLVPMPFAELHKTVDGLPLNDGFAYSYALVSIRESIGTPSSGVRIGADIQAPPARTDAIVSRVVRDTSLSRQLKALHGDICQRCRTRLETDSGAGYSEAHHIKPLGRPHSGPDRSDNVIVVCPNCHALYDLGAVVLNRDDLRMLAGHEIHDDFIQYHNDLIYTKAAG